MTASVATATPRANIQSLSGDFAPVIGDPAFDVFVGRVREVHAAVTKEGAYTRTLGTFSIEVGEMLAQSLLRPGSVVTLGFHQIAGPPLKRSGENQWDAMHIAEGNTLLLACKSPDGGHTWQAVAGLNADAVRAGDIATIHQAYRIEAAHGDEKVLRLGNALASAQPLLLSYALRALGERNVLGPEQAIHLMSLALILPTEPPDNRENIGGGLAEVFDRDGVGDANRSNILGALALAMANAKEKAEQADWAALLRSCLMSKEAGDDAHRYALVKNIRVPPAERVIQVLTELQHDRTDEPDAEERALLARMAHIWQIAKR